MKITMADTKTLDKIIEEISKLSVLEVSELVKALEEKLGVSAAPVAVAGAAAPAAEAEVEEKTEYDVVITAAGDNKIAAIKAVREIKTDLGLVQAKELVEKAPVTVLEKAKKEDAEEAKKKLEDAGVKVELK